MKPTKGISVDGGCSGNPGNAYYRAVDIETGEELFNVNIGIATNNIAEFLGACHALYYRNNKNLDLPIYSDSKTAITWIKNKKANTSYSESSINDKLRKAENFLKGLKDVKILKWETSLYGEIPADFGLKSK